MVKVSFLGAILLLLSINLQAALTVELERYRIQQGETLRMMIDLEGVDADQIDLTPLEKEFEILGRSRQSSTTINNGSFQSKTQLIVTLMPKKSGDLTIPAFTAEGESSQPIAVKVLEVDQPKAEEGGIEFLSTLSSEKAYPQQPLVYHTTLLVGRQIDNGQFRPPEITQGEAQVEPYGEQKRYSQIMSGHTVHVVEQSWLITPQQSGPLTINEAAFIAQVRSNSRSRDPFGNGFFADPRSVRRLQIPADSYQLDVKPIPSNYQGNTWLPAEDVQLEQEWSGQQLTEGEPVTRTIKLTVTGLAGHQLPELLLPEASGFKQYISEPEVEQQVSDGQLISTMQLEVTVIPTQSGMVKIPDFKLNWWDTQADRQQVTVLEGQQFKVKAGQITNQVDTAPVRSEPVQAVINHEQTQKPIEDSQIIKSSGEESSTPGYLWLVMTTLLGAVIGATASWLLMRNRIAQPLPQPEPVSSKSSMFDVKQLKAACRNNDAQKAREALLQWGGTLEPACSNLNQLQQQVTPALVAAITELNQNSYSQKQEQWQGSKLWQAFADQPQNSRVKEEEERLEPMYR